MNGKLAPGPVKGCKQPLNTNGQSAARDRVVTKLWEATPVGKYTG